MKANTTRQAKIKPTSTPNFYDVESSNGFDHYPLLLTAPGCCRCGCPAGEAGRACYHRTYALVRFQYVPETLDLVDEFTLYRLNRIEDEWTLDAVRNLFSDGPEAA